MSVLGGADRTHFCTICTVEHDSGNSVSCNDRLVLFDVSVTRDEAEDLRREKLAETDSILELIDEDPARGREWARWFRSKWGAHHPECVQMSVALQFAESES